MEIMPIKKPVLVRNVFAENLSREFWMINSVIARYPVVSMDTEFPGTIFKEDKHLVRESNPNLNYRYMKSNVDALKIIQLGLTLSDSQGNLPDFDTPFCYIWEFNFKDFDIDEDRYDNDSIQLLARQGIDFKRNKERGIDSRHFKEEFLRSGLAFDPCHPWNVTWITFHSAYDFGFMLKILTQSTLPDDLNMFGCRLFDYFGHNVFDIKNMFRPLNLQGGLEKVAQTLKVARVAGSRHQAGSDSLLILQCFIKLRNSKVFESNQMNRILPPLALFGLVPVIE